MQNYFKWKTGIATPNESKASYGAGNCKSMEYKPQNVICQNCSGEFIIEPDDFSFYEKMKVPAPHVCPDCRFKMRAIFRNENKLYSGRKCDLCQKSIIAMYNPKSPYKVYCPECYASDNWDRSSYAKDYDFSKSFFEQLKELTLSVPKMNLYVTYLNGPVINSPFNNGFGGAKNCYYLFNGGPAENTQYSRGVKDVKDISDCYFSTKIENSYEAINVHNSNKIFFSQNVTNSIESAFLINCNNCINCIGCVNLNNKSNCILNEQYTKEGYIEKVNEIFGSYEKIEDFKKSFYEFSLTFPHRENNNIKTVDSTGDYLSECKNVKNSMEITQSENVKDAFSSKQLKDSIGVFGYGFSSESLLEVVATGHSSNIIGSYGIDESMNIEYSFCCFPNNAYLIGCDSLKNSKYCILNKQYTKEEYEKIREHIVKELTDLGIYGLMMPPSIAPFAYNETIAQDNMPLTKEEAIAQGFRWEDDIQKTEGKETIKPEQIPDHIRDVEDSITKEILCCIECNRNYKITEQELLFYRKMILPIPRKCFYCRHKSRIEKRGPYKFWNRNCAKCEKEIITNYSPERPEIVYCERCYQSEVY